MLITVPEANILNALDDAACIFEHVPQRPDGLRDYRYLFVNDAFRKLFGTPDLAGLSVRDNFPDEPESWYDDYDEVLFTGVPKRFVREAPSQNMIIEMYVTRLEDCSGKRLMNTMRNVTLAKQMEKAVRDSEAGLKESEANIRNIIMQAPVAMGLLTGPEFIIEIINDNFIALWGKDGSVRGKPIMEALPEMKGQPYPDILRHVYETGETYSGNEDKVLLFRNGKLEQGYFNFVNEPFRNAEGKISGVIVVANEVTAQVIANQNLRQALEKVRLAKEAAELGMFDYDLVNNTLEWDIRCRELFGIRHNEPITYERDFLGGLHPDDRGRLDVLVKDSLIKHKTDGIYNAEYRTVGQDDGQERWVRAKGQAYFDEEDKPVRLIGSVLDITDTKRYEEEQQRIITQLKQDDLRKNDFIGMVSHELKTPLTSLTAIVQVLKSKLSNSEDNFLQNVSANADKQVKRMTRMINGFLNVSRLESGKILLNKENFDLLPLVEEAVAEIRLQSPGQVFEIRDGQSINIDADRDKIGSVISNLLSNAAKYSSRDTSIIVTFEPGEKQVVLSVKDYGIGIKSEDQGKLFERYYRVADERTRNIAGFGIGLYLSAEIIHLHGGDITVESTPDQGSTFRFSLPL